MSLKQIEECSGLNLLIVLDFSSLESPNNPPNSPKDMRQTEKETNSQQVESKIKRKIWKLSEEF